MEDDPYDLAVLRLISDIFATDKLRSINNKILRIWVQIAYMYKLQTVFLDTSNWRRVVLQEIVKEHDSYRGF